jgi:hypothetical protein
MRRLTRAAVLKLRPSIALRTLIGDVTNSQRHARKVRRMAGRK